MEKLASVDWLHARLGSPDLVLLDCSVAARKDANGATDYISGADAYAWGHIPGAGFADLTGPLSDTTSPLRFALPDATAFGLEMARLGVVDGKTVLLYDRGNTAWAARVWWMLRWIGFDNALILDGGQAAWLRAGHPLSTAPVTPAAPVMPAEGKLSIALRPEAIADQADIHHALAETQTTLFDTLGADVFTGAICPYPRPGHITGAENVPTLDLFDDDGCFKPAELLAAQILQDRSQRLITYCGAGILASVNAFVLVQLGFANVAVYIASLQEWAADPQNPMDITAK